MDQIHRDRLKTLQAEVQEITAKLASLRKDFKKKIKDRAPENQILEISDQQGDLMKTLDRVYEKKDQVWNEILNN